MLALLLLLRPCPCDITSDGTRMKISANTPVVGEGGRGRGFINNWPSGAHETLKGGSFAIIIRLSSSLLSFLFLSSYLSLNGRGGGGGIFLILSQAGFRISILDINIRVMRRFVVRGVEEFYFKRGFL